jgi:hypothetical protein
MPIRAPDKIEGFYGTLDGQQILRTPSEQARLGLGLENSPSKGVETQYNLVELVC